MRLQVWDSQTLECIKTLEGHEDNVRVLAVGEKYVFSGSWDKTIRVWDLDTLDCTKVRLTLSELQSSSYIWSPVSPSPQALLQGA